MAKARSTRAATSLPPEGRARAVIENVSPAVDGGRFPVKRVAGEPVDVEADCCGDGHDVVACAVRWWREGERTVNEVPMTALGNDRYRGVFPVPAIGRGRSSATTSSHSVESSAATASSTETCT